MRNLFELNAGQTTTVMAGEIEEECQSKML